MTAEAPTLLDVVEDRGSHPSHSGDRIWPETNCYLDLWIELLHTLGHDPVPMYACALSADHDGEQWTFVKPDPADIRDLYGLQVAEETLWRPVLDTVESGRARGLLHTVEVDSWWLPDTAGTDYRSGHVKTTIVPLRVDRAAGQMTYVHNSGVHQLEGDDFVGVFNLGPTSEWVLLPYVEQVRRIGPADAAIDPLTIVRAHLDRRPAANPVKALTDMVAAAVDWLPDAGVEVFHVWAFATLRQCGATAEIAADLADRLPDFGAEGGERAAPLLREVASSAKAVQFKMARAARGRKVDVSETMATMADNWQQALDIIDASVRR